MQILSRDKNRAVPGYFLSPRGVDAADYPARSGAHQQRTPPRPELWQPACDRPFLARRNTQSIAIGTATCRRYLEATKRGGGVSGRGDSRYRYAKITIPALAAGELRVFDDNNADGPSDAVLCQGSSQVARSITSYTAHNSAHSRGRGCHHQPPPRPPPVSSLFNDNNDDTDTDVRGRQRRHQRQQGRRPIAPKTPSSTRKRAVSPPSQAPSARPGAPSVRPGAPSGTAARALNTAAALLTPSATDRTAIEGHATTARNAEQAALTSYNNRTDEHSRRHQSLPIPQN